MNPVSSWLKQKWRSTRPSRSRPNPEMATYLKDYVDGGLRLFWQRQAMYLGAFILASAYYDIYIAVLCYFGVLLSELFDHFVAKRISTWDGLGGRTARLFYRMILLGTILNALAIGSFIVLATIMEGTSAHFTPLLFLFAAALFAAMNTHQVLSALVLRLAIYFGLFLFVAFYNIVKERPQLSSVHWLQFFTVVFVLYFIVDCSIAFLRLYRRNLSQIDELRREHERALAAYRSKSEFLSVVSHELRTPITSIKGPLNLICSGVLGQVPNNIQQMLAVASKNSDRLAMLIDDLLDLQALDTGKMAMNVKPMDLSTLLRDAIEATAGYLRDKNVSLILVGSHPPVMVNGDEKRLMQVMANVLSNAIKFSKDGGIVQVRLETHEDLATVSVRDNGRGIPPGSEQTVFGEFSQIDSSDVRSVGGSGLGMSISRRILLLHKGTIGYESEVGVGTNFIITLPVFSAPIEVQGQGRPGSRGAAGAVETVPI